MLAPATSLFLRGEFLALFSTRAKVLRTSLRLPLSLLWLLFRLSPVAGSSAEKMRRPLLNKGHHPQTDLILRRMRVWLLVSQSTVLGHRFSFTVESARLEKTDKQLHKGIAHYS